MSKTNVTLRFRAGVLVVATVTLALVHAAPALACDCSMRKPADALEQADLVFSGPVVSARLARPSEPDGEALTIVEFAIARSWKGRPIGRIVLHTQRNSVSCEGKDFIVGQRYLVFARKNSPQVSRRYPVPSGTVTYGVSMCGGTQAQAFGVTSPYEQELNRLVIQVR